MRTMCRLMFAVALGVTGCSDEPVSSSVDKSNPGQKDASVVATKSCKCAVDSDCTTAAGNIYKGCNTSTGACAYCKQDGDCINGPKKCNAAVGSCVQCAVDSDCATLGTNLKCNTASGTCVGCLADSDCGTFGIKKCDTANGVCKLCATDADCAGSPASLTDKCDPGFGQCIRCDTDADCNKVVSSSKVCGPNKRCVGCKSDADCAGAALKTCDTATGTCSICTGDSECTGGFAGVILKCK